MMKRAIKIVGCTVLAVACLKACQMDYVCCTVETIPAEIQARLIQDNPELADIDKLAEFWVHHGDSVCEVIEYEQKMGVYYGY